MIEVYKIMHKLYDNESARNLLKWEDVTIRSGNRGHSLKLFTQRSKIIIVVQVVVSNVEAFAFSEVEQ